MRPKFLICALVLLSLCCEESLPPLNFQPKHLSEYELELCKDGPCPQLDLSYLQVEGNGERIDKINQELSNLIVEFLSYDSIIPASRSIEEAASQFAEEYQAFKTDFPESTITYEAETSSSVIYDDAKLLCVAFDAYAYTGGAHGYGYRQCITFEISTGKVLSLGDFFTDLEQVTAFAKAEFLKKNGFSKDTPLSETGFWFDEEQFYLPENVAVHADSLVFTYNQYEIASYADGPQTLSIAIADLGDWWRFK
ncbi:DUF3298 and DUF4163 domain-containing protein [Croceiramulus getboli]|nr:DUF3298 and DUF4163 domain-containing protein [Flavobacteriaceae bacterium YJPT1-3]